MGLRLFDVEKKQWTDYWVNAKSGAGREGMPGSFATAPASSIRRTLSGVDPGLNPRLCCALKQGGAVMRGRGWMTWGQMIHGEYRATLNGLNIFFGAVLGVVMAGTESLKSWDFAFVLLLTAATIVAILNISTGTRRIVYAIVAATAIFFLPWLMEKLLSAGAALPDKLQPTLAVWAAMTIAIEFAPREKPLAGVVEPEES
jgi:hypothetical protein